jgi:WD40 repeat protein
MKRTFYLFIFLFILVCGVNSYALTPEEILLLRKAGVPEEKILEMQKKDMEKKDVKPLPALPINPFDWNEDGKKDILLGSRRGQVYVYLNKGTNSQPQFDKPVELADLEVMSFSDPYVVDWNNDGKKDVVMGLKSGEVFVFINRGTNQQPLFGSEMKLNDGDLDVGFFSSPAMADWNGDGKRDLIVGNQKGKVIVFFNIGEDSKPEFSSKGVETDVRVPDYATPFIVDWNNDKRFDILSGAYDGKIYIFINEGDNKRPLFKKPFTIQVNNKELKLPSPTSVIALDWNDDGKTDLLVANKEIVEKDSSTGREEIIPFEIYLLLNTGTKEKPEFKELKPIKAKFKDNTGF